LHLPRKLAIPAATALAAALVPIAASAPSASASAIYTKNGTYQFASNTDTSGSSVFRISNSAFSYSDSSQSLGASGVGLSITPDQTSGYADSGVIVDLGDLDSLFSCPGGNCTYNPPAIVGSSDVAYNLYFDTDGNGGYLAFSSNGVYAGPAGDNIADLGAAGSASASFQAGQQGNGTFAQSFAGQTETMQDVLGAFNARSDGGTKDPEVWAWIGISGSSAETGYVTSVDGTPLVTEVPAVNPVTGLKATAMYTNLTATWKAAKGATKYQVTVTTHKGSVTVAKATVPGLSYKAGHLKEKTSYAVHVLAEPAATGAKPATVYVTTK
jgi:hypothetical protein